MRTDGIVSFYFIQHRDGRGEWARSALDHFLFRSSPDSDRTDRYRELLEPQSASSELWQTYGIHGFAFEGDARDVLTALKVESPDTEFRIAHRTIAQHTEVAS